MLYDFTGGIQIIQRWDPKDRADTSTPYNSVSFDRNKPQRHLSTFRIQQEASISRLAATWPDKVHPESSSLTSVNVIATL